MPKIEEDKNIEEEEEDPDYGEEDFDDEGL